MPIIKSAKKRVKIAAKANARNTRTRRNLREALKGFAKAIENGKPAEISKAQNEASSAIDMAYKKNVIHRNKAARKKAQLSAQAKAVGVKPSKAGPKSLVASKKPKTKKPIIKKTSPAKKPSAKK